MHRAVSHKLAIPIIFALLAALTGCGSLTGPAISFSPTSLNFKKAETKSITVTNISGSELTISNQSLGESSVFELKDPNKCKGKSLANGGTCKYEITVIKYEAGHSTHLVVITSAGDGEADIETS
jgi:hypothetical protein